MENLIVDEALLTTRPKLAERIQARLPVSVLELSLVFSAFILVWLGLFRVAGGPLYSDELWYIHTGLNNVAAPNVLNRYFHIYLQKFFMELAPTPLLGVQIFWGFLVSFSAVLVYLTARILSKSTHFLHGLLGVAVFFSFRPLAEYSGITVVDITAMAMLALFIFLYVYAIRFEERGLWAVYLLGFLFFLAFKTKETTIVTGLLLLGFGFVQEKRYSLRKLLKHMRRFALGVAGGVLFFILLNSLILKDPLFGLTPAHFMAFSNELRTTVGLNPEMEDWFTKYLLPVMPVTFLLFIISGVKSKNHFTPAIRLLWLIPLLLILFLSVSMIKGDWGIRTRHLFPILPLLSLLAPQFLHFHMPSARKERTLLAVSLASGFAALILIRFIMQYFLPRMGGDVTAFMVEALFPIALSILLGLLIMKEHYSVRSVAVPLACLGLLLYSSLSSNAKELFLSSPPARHFQSRIYPFTVFGGEIRFRDEMKMLISSTTAEAMRNPGTNPDIMLSLFNFHFQANAQRKNFSFIVVDENSKSEDFSELYDYIFFTRRDWGFLEENPAILAHLENNYDIHTDRALSYYFLNLK
jgi:hypothetical protein